MKKEYDTFVDTLDSLPQGKEAVLVIRDLTPGKRKYTCQCVKAVVSPAAEELPDGDLLWVRLQLGARTPQPWTIKIVEVLGDHMIGRQGT